MAEEATGTHFSAGTDTGCCFGVACRPRRYLGTLSVENVGLNSPSRQALDKRPANDTRPVETDMRGVVFSPAASTARYA